MIPVNDPQAPHRLPTLTEVVALGDAPPAGAAAAPAPVAGPALPDEGALVAQVLADVQRQVELMLEYRLREALAPALARATDTLVREARNGLAGVLREVVARAVAQELARHRDGPGPR